MVDKDKDEVSIEHVRGSGKGGQHRNKRFTGVRVIDGTTGIAVVATERRSQSQNLRNALERLADKVARAKHRPKKRVATRKTASSVKRRLNHKKKTSNKKSQRRDKGDW